MQRQRVYDGFVKVDIVDTTVGKREVVVATDSVAFLVYNKTKEEFLLVTQDRVPMAGEDGVGRITEVAAGRFDKDIGVKGLVVQELQEELGVTVSEDDVELINAGVPLALSPGVLTERQHLAYVEIEQDHIDPNERVFGCATEGERIVRHYSSLTALLSQPFQDMKTFALVHWFISQRDKRRVT